jgi:putative Holliday junction resolvase
MPMRTMGLDVGTKTVGVAVSDELGLTAQGVTTVRRTNLRTDLAELKKIIAERGVEHVVIGLPLNMDGSEGPRAQASREFGDQVVKATGLTVEYWDERLSTAAAQRVLLEADVSRQKRRQVVDQMAASIILQGWMDARRPALESDYDEDWSG